MYNINIMYVIKNIDRLSKEQIISELEEVQKEYIDLKVSRAGMQKELYQLKVKLDKIEGIINDTKEGDELIPYL